MNIENHTTKEASSNTASLENFPRMEKDGLVAVLYSPGFGAGWSTWVSESWAPLLSLHRDIVQSVLDDNRREAARLAEALIREATGKPDAYVCTLGANDLKVEWIAKGSRFEIEDYDGYESVHVIGSRSYEEA